MKVSFVFLSSISLFGALSLRGAEAFSSNNNNNNKTPPSPPPPRQTPDERQMRMLQQMGYTWNGKAWIRGDADAYKAQRAVARSSNRFIRVVDKDGKPTSSEAAVAASKRLEQVLSKSRLDVMPQTKEELARDGDFKNFIQRKEAPFVWFAGQTAILAALSLVKIQLPSGIVSIHWSTEFQQLLDEPLLMMSLGLVAGVILAICRDLSRSLLPGVEEYNGKLERILADAMDGNFALPAPYHYRYSSNNWKLFALVGESIAAINVSIVMNGLLQPILIRFASDSLVWRLVATSSDSPVGQYIALVGAWGAAFLVALLAAIPAMVREPLDGIPAECQGVLRAKQTAGAYFNMNTPKDANPIETTTAFQVLADGWIDKFENVEAGAEWKQPALAYVGSLACATAWQLSGGALAAPCLARVVAAAVTYIVLDEQESCRASVVLPSSLLSDEHEPR